MIALEMEASIINGQHWGQTTIVLLGQARIVFNGAGGGGLNEM